MKENLNRDSEQTQSGIKLKDLYYPDGKDVSQNYLDNIGLPGKFPFTRGIYPEMYRQQLWTSRLATGMGDTLDTNSRLKELIANGQSGISIAFDLGTLDGLDSDNQLSQMEFGKCGVSVSTVDDLSNLFKDIDLSKYSVSLNSNAITPPMLAMFIAAAERQGVKPEQLKGTTQNDPLKEMVSQNEFNFELPGSLRLVTDTIEYAAEHLPHWNIVNVSGYHIREAGATAIEELAFTISNALQYVNDAESRKLNIDDFVPKMSFYFNVGNDFFEEIAKFRAARRIWAKLIKEKGAKNERSMWLKFHAHTSGASLTAQDPLNNISRATTQTLAAILGGAQSIHTCSFDEALALPTEQAANIALATQMILAYESGIPNVIDPLGGSYFIENLTDEFEQKTMELIGEINKLGGAAECIRSGYYLDRIRTSAQKKYDSIDSGATPIISSDKIDNSIPLQKTSSIENRFRAQNSLREFKKHRNTRIVNNLLEQLKKDCESEQNVMPTLIDLARNNATLEEMTNVLKLQFGEFQKERPMTIKARENITIPEGKKIKVLIAKVGLDGHDLGARFVSQLLADAGMEVIYSGKKADFRTIVELLETEKFDALGISINSGSHIEAIRALGEEIDQLGITGKLKLFVGGTIPSDHISFLKKMGVNAVFGPGSKGSDIIDAITKLTKNNE